MPIDILNLPINANKFIYQFLDNSSLLQLRKVSKSAKELADFSHQRFSNTLVSLLEFSKEQNKTRVAFRYLFRRPSASNYWDYYASKTCFKCAMLNLNISVYWFSEYRKINTFVINCSNNAAYLQVIKQVKPQKINFATQVFPKDTTEFVLELANQVQSISVCYGYRFFGDTIRPSPNIIAFTQEIVVRKCENIEIVDICSSRNHTVADTETLIKILHQYPEKMLSLSYYEDRSEPTDDQIGSYKLSSDVRRWLTIKHFGMTFFIMIRRRSFPYCTSMLHLNRSIPKSDSTKCSAIDIDDARLNI
ncbi:hypothetical protein PRIPAC_90822 [Pristionchus pacificus]|uniref:F-box domain-containing protein n=1 Tax=Pristionchus pacificus TaxID=54126 RepID=A0A2A6CWT1_PRIPA|nr:hypothetical protein PRIPAC_90822 [Pristionchus pacificus]|eukprot:PDM82682.1 hypothetical protein PRIPAC_37075 [Pristionchus pacificus]